MGRIVYLMGKSSSGKDTIFKRLLADRELGLKTIVPYTTRPIRRGEQDGLEYFFTDEDGYRELKESGKIIEERTYRTFQGLWRYFTIDDGQIRWDGQNYIMIGTLEAYLKMKEYFGEDRMLPVMIELEDGIRLERALSRERKQKPPQYEEMCRRFLADSEDFSEEKIREAGIRRRFQNDDLERCLAEISAYINNAGNMPI
ncbi:MAG: guanylate kinase [Lachnospiraceae bacterium]|nr:guanylate kinase [Lachnospiraceae bacterium]MCM1239880.1 guanylate kinase [Lachnospiraceae bacterium]MCM1304522.1 guanylate kinase [Butyrivibrio sp.]MCM1411440.1 guanylate kinase [Lachnospiraceae bacterium]